MRELQIAETFNPGAISSVEIIDIAGHHTTLYAACGGQFVDYPTASDRPCAPALLSGGARMTHVALACGTPVAAVRVTLASAAVTGWNEIDAIGGVPCDAQ
jgi:hypothetical protein